MASMDKNELMTIAIAASQERPRNQALQAPQKNRVSPDSLVKTPSSYDAHVADVRASRAARKQAADEEQLLKNLLDLDHKRVMYDITRIEALLQSEAHREGRAVLLVEIEKTYLEHRAKTKSNKIAWLQAGLRVHAEDHGRTLPQKAAEKVYEKLQEQAERVLRMHVVEKIEKQLRDRFDEIKLCNALN